METRAERNWNSLKKIYTESRRTSKEKYGVNSKEFQSAQMCLDLMEMIESRKESDSE